MPPYSHAVRNARRLALASLAALAFAVSVQTDAHAAGLHRRSTLGIALSPAPADSAEFFGLPAGTGIVLKGTVPGGAADKAGLKAGDWLVTLDGQPLAFDGFTDRVAAMESGRAVRFGVIRAGQRLTVSAKPIERPRDPGTAQYSVVYDDVVSNGHRMRTLTTHPRKSGKHPALLFIQGYSPVSYDYVLEGPGLDAPILRAFAHADFVTLRVDKPGVGDSEGGPFSEVDFVTEADIYRQALITLRAMPDVDTSQVYIFGHSMGGAFGPVIAAEIPVRGIALYGVVGRTWHEYFLDVMRYQNLLAGQTYGAIDETVRQTSRVMTYVFQDHLTPADVKRDHPELAGAVDAVFPGGQFNGKTARFWEQLEDTNFASLWEQIGAHVLSVHGASDYVSYAVDHQLIADVVNRAHPGYGRYVSLPNSDHVFATWPTEAESMQHFPNGETNTAFATLVLEWIAGLPASKG
ncbi:MAG: alpha/beta fold hydrolase [Candidatus Eisenbacteria bacterium]|nr:alpha/beta fold hydrolase [Candidatus Eisenbacteria bacterium]